MKIALVGDTAAQLAELLRGDGHEVVHVTASEQASDEGPFDIVCHAPGDAEALVTTLRHAPVDVGRERPLCGLTFNVKRHASSDLEA